MYPPQAARKNHLLVCSSLVLESACFVDDDPHEFVVVHSAPAAFVVLSLMWVDFVIAINTKSVAVK